MSGGQSEKLEHQQRLAMLGGQLASLTHDLKSPIAASSSAVSILGSAIIEWQQRTLDLQTGDASPDQQEVAEKVLASLANDASQAGQLDPLEQADKEADVNGWLDAHAIPDGWKLAPALVDAGYDVSRLTEILDAVAEDRIEAIILWLYSGLIVREAIQTIEVAVNELRDRTVAISDLTRNQSTSSETISLEESISRARRLFRHELGRLDLTIDLDIAAGQSQIPRNLIQVWTNLIGNAIDALDGKGTLIFRAREVDRGLVVQIQDDGPGIPGDILDRIFDPYITSKPAGKGTGLGLNISQQIVNRAGGAIEVASQPGLTVFTVRLPCSVEGE